jgi:hypothetical protein
MSFSLMGQNRKGKSSGGDKTCGSLLSRHRPDAQVALQQSPILQSDMDRITEARYNGKRELKSLRSFTQFHEHTLIIGSMLFHSSSGTRQIVGNGLILRFFRICVPFQQVYTDVIGQIMRFEIVSYYLAFCVDCRGGEIV